MQIYDKGVISIAIMLTPKLTPIDSYKCKYDSNPPQMTCAAEEGSIPLCYFNYNNAFHLYFLYCEFYIIQTNIFH